jgi:hypothetical protein
MTTRTLVDRHKSWTKTERLAYAGQTVELTDERDYAGKRLGILTSGPLLGTGHWFGSDEIAEGELTDEESPSPSPATKFPIPPSA